MQLPTTDIYMERIFGPRERSDMVRANYNMGDSMSNLGEHDYYGGTSPYSKKQTFPEFYLEYTDNTQYDSDALRADEQESDSDEFAHTDMYGLGLPPQPRGRFCRWLSDRVDFVGESCYHLGRNLTYLADWLYYKDEA